MELFIQVLSRYDGEKGVLLCLNVIKNIGRHQRILLVIDHMLKHLRKSINHLNFIQLSTHQIGLKVGYTPPPPGSRK